MAGRGGAKVKSKRFMRSTSDKLNSSLDKGEDVSLLRKPFKTSATNLPKLIKLFQNTTDEIRRYLTHENDILHECRICRSIFRSVSNFILHKKSYCQEQYSFISHLKSSEDEEGTLIFERPAGEDKEISNVSKPKNTLDSVLERIAQKKLSDIEKQVEIMKEINQQTRNDSKKEIDVVLDHIDTTSAAVFQTIAKDSRVDRMKNEVMELHEMLNGGSAILGPDGKVFNINQKTINYLKSVTNTNSDLALNELSCEDCNVRFSTRKTYLSHMKYKHNEMQMIFPCPVCSDTFANRWSVYRHMINVHRKTIPQVRRLRSQIQLKAYRKNEAPVKRPLSKLKKNEQNKTVEENQAWVDNFEEFNNIQMCSGCGRKFERKAALNSHSQMCTKKIASQNSISSNKLKRPMNAEEKAGKKLKPNIQLKNCDKRKPQNSTRKKIEIQIRCDYTNLNKTSTKENSESNESHEEVTKLPNEEDFHRELSQDSQENVPKCSSPYLDGMLCNAEALYTIIGVSRNQHEDSNSKSPLPIQENPQEVIFFSNTDTVFEKEEEEDPLCLKDIQNESDSEIEEIINNSFELNNSSGEKLNTNENLISSESDMLTNTNDMLCENTLKLMQILNGTEKKNINTLDYRMNQYVDLRFFQCNICHLKFQNISKLRAHMALHFNWMRFRCDICEFKAYDKVTLQNHIMEVHNVQQCEKIEAVIFQMPEWETISMSFLTLHSIEGDEKQMNVSNDSMSVVLISDKEEDESVSPLNSDSTTNTVLSKHKGRGRPKKLKRVPFKKKLELNETDKSETEINSPDIKEQLEAESPSKCDSTKNDCNNIQDSNLRKMVYEVIFGENSETTMNTSESKSKDGLTEPDVAAVSSRPVRNRKHHMDKDFVYDLHEFKDLSKKTSENNETKIDGKKINMKNTENDVKFENKKVLKQYVRRPGPRCKTYVNYEPEVDKSTANPVERTESVLLMNPPDSLDDLYEIETVSVNCDGALHSDSDDSDIYIIENGETRLIRN